MTHLRHVFRTQPRFRRLLGQRSAGARALDRAQSVRLPLLTWTVRTPEQRARAARYADQMIFEALCRNLTAGQALEVLLLQSWVQCTMFGVAVAKSAPWTLLKSPSKPCLPSAMIAGRGMGCLRQSGAGPDSLNGLDTLAGSCPLQNPATTPSCRMRFSRPPRQSGSAIAAHRLGAAASAREDRDGRIAGIVPCYLKSHSQGEYVFDRGWADAYERAGGRYYPKLQASVPFTPATGPRLLIRDGVDRERDRQRARAGLVALCDVEQGLLRACHLRARGRMESFSPSTASCSGPTSNFTGTTRTMRPSTISSAASIRATARRSSASGARRSPPTSPSTRSPAGHHRRRLGRVLRLLHGDRLAQMGPALPHAIVLLADRREHEPRTCCW